MSYNAAALSNLDFTPGPLGGGNYTATSNNNSGHFNLFLTSTKLTTALNTTWFTSIPATYAKIGTLRAEITDPNAAAGIAFLPENMDNQQIEKLFADPWIRKYAVTNVYEGNDFKNLYLGRVYSTESAWSQYGGTTLDLPVLNWAVEQSTSIWDGNATLNSADHSAALIKNFQMESGATFTVPANKWLTLSGTVNNSGSLVVNSTGSLINNMAVVPAATVELTMEGKSGTTEPWYLFSAPVGGQSIESFLSRPSNSIATSPNGLEYGLAAFDNNSSHAWAHYPKPYTGGDEFIAGRGYEVLRDGLGPVTFTGTLAANQVDIAVTTGLNNWNLIGNPYSSAINGNNDADADHNFLKSNEGKLTSEHKAMYLWDHDSREYQPVNHASPYFVPPGQAVFVCVASSGNLSFMPDMRTHSLSALKTVKNAWPCVKIKALIAGKSRSARVYYIPGTTSGVDEGYDAAMFDAFGIDSVSVFTHIEGSDSKFAIQSLPDEDYENTVVTLGLNAPRGVVNLAADVANLPVGTRVYLEDRLTGIFTRLDESGSFCSVDLSTASNGTGRFFIHTKQGSMGMEEQILADVKVIALPAERLIRVLGMVEPSTQATVYDMNGKILVTCPLYKSGINEIPFMPLSSGLYLLKLQTGTEIKSQKINWIY
jgi:hypothetical protein